MKMGEIRVRPDGGFTMMTPGRNVRDVTLRCRTDGVVVVEDVVDGALSIAALRINQISQLPERTGELANHIHRLKQGG